MQHTTFLEATGNLIGLLIFVIIPLVLVIMLVIKNPQTTLSLIKAVFNLLMSAAKFIAPFIMPFLIWITDRWAIHDDEPIWPSSSDDGYSTLDVDTVRTYQNGVDGPERNPGTTFYH